MAVQPRAAEADAVFVVTNASEARLPEVSALLALNPNHPNQRREAPRIVIVRSWGMMVSLS